MKVDARARSIPWPALARGLAAALALVVSTYNVYLQRTQIRAQVWPHLEWMTTNQGGYAFTVQNSGVGPAQLRTVRVTVDGAPATSWPDVITRVTGGNAGFVLSALRDRVIGAGVTLEPLRIPDEVDAGRFKAGASRIAIEICYCSTLDDCWRLRASAVAGSVTEEVDGCSTSGPLFEHR